MLSRYYIAEDKKWLKFGDILENTEARRQLDEWFTFDLEPDYNFRTMINAELSHRYKYRYLFCNNYQSWMLTFHNVIISIRLQYNLHKCVLLYDERV